MGSLVTVVTLAGKKVSSLDEMIIMEWRIASNLENLAGDKNG
jgi:hypothetical protein